MRFLLAVLVTLTAVATTYASLYSAQKGQIIEGIVQAVGDGDGIVVNGMKIRLFGIDAFENDRPRGREARVFLKRWVEGHIVRCVVQDYDAKFQRFDAVCFDQGGRDLSCGVAWNGYAVEWKTKSLGRYTPCDRITPLQENPPPGPQPVLPHP